MRDQTGCTPVLAVGYFGASPCRGGSARHLDALSTGRGHTCLPTLKHSTCLAGRGRDLVYVASLENRTHC